MNEKNENKKTKKVVILVICVALLSGVFGFAGSFAYYKLFHKDNGITIEQNNSEAVGKVNALDVSDVVDACHSSVVEISTETATNGNNPFQQYIMQGAGSGVILSEDGYIVTNHHVIDEATSIIVRTVDGKEYPAKIVGSDAQTDLAVLKVEAKNLHPTKVGNSNQLQVGDTAIAIGNPLGSLGGTVTTGIISALNREITIEGETMTLLQTDTAINPGNSGGGLFDAKGDLIGIVNAKQSAEGIEGLGFAIPISDALPILDELIENGHVVSRPALNLSLYDVQSNRDSDSLNLKEGVYVVQIVPNGAADKAGLQQMDRIVSFDGKEVKSASEIKDLLKKHKVGETLKIVIERNNKKITKDITLKSSTVE